MRTDAVHAAATTGDPRHQEGRGCDHPECASVGLYRAPKARDRLRDYYWFCLDHVRAYNNAWNYCAGFSETEIEAQIRAATCWERPTWRLGQWHSFRTEDAMRGFGDTFNADAADPERDNRSRRPGGQPRVSDAAADALAVLGLAAGATLVEIKARYKLLVKRHHPDANGGDKQAEERLKVINQSYTFLRMHARSCD